MDRLAPPEISGIPTIEEILARPDSPLSDEGQAVVRRAYELAQKLHENQRRKSGDPYFVHCARVGLMLAGLVNDYATIAAGLLHDTVEDCGITVEKLNALFPAPIAELVDGVTKISALNFSSDQEHQVGNLRKMILAMARDVRVVLIKLCDRLHNMQTLHYLNPQRQREIARTTLEVYAPLANRLGMTLIRAQLEDLSMQYLYPAAYTRLARKMAVRQARDQVIVDRTRDILTEHLEQAGIPASVVGRRKHIYSLYQKMQRQGLRFDEVHDILAIRVVADTVAECYEILGIVHSIWKPLTGRFKDYIATPKENDYRSIHTTVIGVENEVTEIQIRTQAMHRIAEEGIAAHWKYKEGAKGGNGNWADEQKRLAWLRQLVEWLQDVHDPSEFLQELKRDVFEASVFCYTPKGDIIEIPRGATALDLAYRIHTELGHHCAGAKINQRMVSIRTPVATGDIVEILSSKTAHPTPDWLQFAQTGRARNKIRHWLKLQQHDEFLEHGERLLSETVRSRFGSSVEMEKVNEILGASVRQFQVDSLEDLLIELGCGTIKISSIIGKLEQVLRPHEPKRVPRAVRRKKGSGKDVILVDGMSGAVARMAFCCSPLPGDPIIGFITQGRGISVHRADCKSLDRIRERSADYESRVVPVEWGDASQSLQKAAVRIVCQDRKGLLSDVSSAITQLNVNIVGTHSTSNLRDNRAIIKIVMLIESSQQLDQILSRLETIPGVISLSRTVHTN